MRVQVADRLSVSEVFDLTSFGELTLSEGGVLVTPTEAAEPGPAAAAVAEQNRLRSLVLDDGLSARVTTTTRPVPVGEHPGAGGRPAHLHGPDRPRLRLRRLAPAARRRHRGGHLRAHQHPARGSRRGRRRRPGGRVQRPQLLPHPDRSRRPRRPDARQLERQAGKIVPAINALGADVVTLLEIEDTDSTGYSPGNADAALADLVRGWTPTPGTRSGATSRCRQELLAVDRDVIRNGILYVTDEVQPVGRPGRARRRGGLGQRPRADRPDVQQRTATASPWWRTTSSPRARAARPGTTSTRATARAMERRPRPPGRLAGGVHRPARRRSGDDDVLLLGDLNAYTQEDPIDVLRAAGFHRPRRDPRPGPLQLRLRRAAPARSTTRWPARR